MKVKFVPDSEEPEAGEIFARLSFDGNTEECFWDTGATSTNVNTNDFFSTYPVLNQGQLVGLAGMSVSTDRILVQDISFDGHKLGRQEVMRLPKTLGVPFTAGIDLFRGQQFSLNSRNQELVFESQNASLNFELGAAGYIIVPVGSGKIQLRTIWDTGAGLTTIDQKAIDENQSIFRFIKKLDVGDTVHARAMQLKLYEMDEMSIVAKRQDWPHKIHPH